MRNFKKALSVFLCAAMMLTTLCFFNPVSDSLTADAAVVNSGSELAFYVPENIYLYPDVTSWTSAVKTPFQYYVGNTVDTADIYKAPVAEANLDSEGKIYFAAKEGMSDVALKVSFLNLDGTYMAEADYGTVNFTTENKGEYYLFTVTDGVSPELAADVSGCYIEWCVTYKNSKGEAKAAFNYSYIYKPYVVPYGAAVRVNNTKGDVNVYGQYITWVTGVHSVDNTASQTNTLYPRYMPLASAYDSTDDTRGEYPFSPFISRDNKAYVGGVEVSGAANVANGGYYAVFAGTDENTAYFWADQQGANFTRSYRVREFFYTARTSATYPVAFDYMNNSSVSTQYALSQVTPTRLGYITVDISRYSNLKDVPNLGVGMMVTDTDVKDAVTSNVPQASAQWYIGDATGKSQLSTGVYDTVNNLSSAQSAVYVKFASGKDLTAPLDKGIWYAGAWNKELNNSTGVNTYTVKSYYEAEDREGDRQAASAAVGLNVNQVDKSALREAVNRAVSNFSALGVKENWNSYYYDINYIDPDTGTSAWERFRTAYINACGALGNTDAALPDSYDGYAAELNEALDALLAGKGLRVYFDVNHDDIGINLWINPKTTYYTWDAENETAVINGSFYDSITFGTTAFTPDEGAYTVNATQVSGYFNGSGCVVLDSVDSEGANVLNGNGDRYNTDFTGSLTRTVSYAAEDFLDVEGLRFWSWYNSEAGDGIYNSFAVKIKIEKGDTATAYSPVGKVVSATYGTLPEPEREGYVFVGWCTDETLSTVVDESSAVSARILYAKWEKAQYNVVFDGNGADGGEMPEQTLTYDEKSNLDLNGYTRTGYVFAGWTDADGNSYADGDEVFNLTSENNGKYTLYAQWTPNQYSVAFDGNTGLGGLGMANAQYDTPFELPANYFIKTGYTFIGWSVTPDGEAIYGDMEEVSNLTSEVNGSVTLYAVWQPNTFRVVFDANSGSGNMDAEDVTYDSGAALPECGFTRTGYTFIGWSLTSDGAELITETQYDKLMTEEGDEVTLYAVWSENSYTLSFDKNGGEGVNIPATVYSYETPVSLPRNVFTREGYVLAGWSLTRNGEVVYANGETVNHITPDKNGSVTLYAVWTPVSYTVRFDANTAEGTIDSVTMTYDVPVQLPVNTFLKTGYHFTGWALTPDGGAVYSDAQEVKNLASADGKEITLYAVWEVNVYKVTLNYYNTYGVLTSVTVNVNHGEDTVLPSDFTTTPVLDSEYHRIFAGWSGDITNVTSDITVTGSYPSTSKEAHNMLVSVTDSSCSKLGEEKHYCENCSYSYSIDIPLKEHSWDSGTVAVEPGCTTNGSTLYSCVNCSGTRSEPIAPTGHSFTAFPATEPTCSTEGNIEHKHCENCTKCFASDAVSTTPDSEALTHEQVHIPKLPHTPPAGADCSNDTTCTVCGESFRVDHSYDETVIEPDCENGGYSIYTCSVCGDTYEGNETSAKGHTEGEWRVTSAPDCTNSGIETNKCSVCLKDWTTRVIGATGHDSGAWEVETPATCEDWGTEALRCTACGVTLTTRGISPKGHGATREEVTVEPGCETAGRNSKICVDCGKELSFTVIPELKHKPENEATCTQDSICERCGILLEEHFGHDWDEGQVTKEPTETETGIMTFTCKNDPSHTYEEIIPVRIVIVVPAGKVNLDAAQNGSAGNIRDLITVEQGMGYTVQSSDEAVVRIDANGNITVFKDGTAVITVTTTDGKFEKSFTVNARTLKTVIFDVNGVITEVKAYAGDKATAPATDDYTKDGFVYSFKHWTVDGTKVSDLTVKGDMTFTAVYTSPCDYDRFDTLTEIFNDVISGSFDNEDALRIYKNEIAAAKELIAQFAADRDTRDADNQALINNAAVQLSGLISKLYPEDSATIEIRGASSVSVGTVTQFNAFMLPLETLVSNGVWTSSDDSVGFFTNGKFYAVKTGTVTITVTSGNITAMKEITVTGGTYARVIMFDTLLSNTNFIVENTLIIKETTNMFWAPDGDIHFRVITDGTFEEYNVYINDKLATPDASGTYTIAANTGDAHVRVDGKLSNIEGEKVSFWDLIRDIFRKIAEFFQNLFS